MRERRRTERPRERDGDGDDDERNHDGDGQILLLCASPEVAAQVEALAVGYFRPATLTDAGKRSWTHAYRFPNGVPVDLGLVLQLLKECVTLSARPGVNLAISVDWFKQPNDDGDLVPTDMGRCINYTKYAPYPNGSGSVAARRQLHDAMTELIVRHPVYDTTRFVTSPPGHKADGNSSVKNSGVRSREEPERRIST